MSSFFFIDYGFFLVVGKLGKELADEAPQWTPTSWNEANVNLEFHPDI
ncbi:hypothetical protein [Paenibacillus agaridevorans]|nr:hypothetical protein [Paenibacillus agaridevorans]